MRFQSSRTQVNLLGLYGLWTLVFLIAMGGAAAYSSSGRPSPPAAGARRNLQTSGINATATAGQPLSYERDVKPLLVARCYACHGNGVRLGDFQIDTREGILTGGQTHPVVVPGSSARSYLMKLVSGEVPGKIMPARGPRLTPKEIRLLRAWIDQGLSFDNTQGASLWKPQVAPRRPKLPSARPGSGLTNPIDLLLQPYFQAHKISALPLVDDRTYARRIYLDVLGLLPPPTELEAFVSDAHADKRVQLARRLLNSNTAYAEHWLTFWNDLLRNDYAGTGYIDGGRTQITDWLYSALLHNMPYDQFVAQLVNPTPDSAGFTKGIVWRGVVNASQTPAMQAAQNISQVFMGVNLKCASCHNSFISSWKLADAYGMAAIYSNGPLEMVRCDKVTGQVAPIKFLYPELGSIDGTAPQSKRREQLASLLTSRANGRLARTFVNRLWSRLMGRGLVEPTDEMDNRPWDPDLLDWLASDFAAPEGRSGYDRAAPEGHPGYDVKRIIEQIVTSRAYQLPAAGLRSERVADYTFTGPVVKRMSAEQLFDAISTLTGVWSRPASTLQIARGRPLLPAGSQAAIRFQSGPLLSETVDIDLDITGARVLSLIVANGENGQKTDNVWVNWAEPRLIGPQGEIKLTDLKWHSATNSSGKTPIDSKLLDSRIGKPLRLGDKTSTEGIGTPVNSLFTYLLPEGVTRLRAKVGLEKGPVQAGVKTTSVELFVVTGDRSLVEARAALALADPLMRALGRPNREQVVTQRMTAATTLQALELTNGQTLETMLGAGAAHWTAKSDLSPPQLVNALYAQALGRRPTAAEVQAALEVVGSPLRQAGVEDLLWTLVMLPEFQLIY